MKALIIGMLVWSAVFIGLVALPTCARAEEPSWHLQVHGVSHHFGDKAVGKWNEKNLGAGVRYQHNETWGVQAGSFRNSYDVQSNYAVIDFTPLLGGSVGVFGGYASGYKIEGPLIGGILLRWQGERVSISARIIPKVRKEHTAVIAFEAGWRFK